MADNVFRAAALLAVLIGGAATDFSFGQTAPLFSQTPLLASDAPAAPTIPEPDVTSTTRPAVSPLPPATAPEASSAETGNFPAAGGSYGLAEFFEHFTPYEPMYFVGGWQAPNVKFQFSIRYRILNTTGPLATEYPLLKGFNFAYSQTSLWDFQNPSNPFFYDSSYRPELFYYMESIPGLKLPPAMANRISNRRRARIERARGN
jgi:hypothetical protein